YFPFIPLHTPTSPLFPYTTLFRSNPNYILPLSFLRDLERQGRVGKVHEHIYALPGVSTPVAVSAGHGRSIAADLKAGGVNGALRSEEHTSELQSRGHLVCRLLLEK